MHFSRWFRRSRQARPTRFVRPSVVALEDRLLPSSFLGGFLLPTPGPATHLNVKVLAFNNTVQSGREFDVVVTARDANNLIAPSFTDQVSFALTPGDANATFPATYTFTPGDHGIHVFDFALLAMGSQTITVSDSTNPAITQASATVTVTPAPAATHFKVLAPPTVLSGGPVQVTVVALDANGFPTTNYTGALSLSVTNGIGVSTTLPVTIAATDHGRQTFVATFTDPITTPATGTFTVTDGTISGTASVTVDPAGAVTHLGVIAFPFSVVGYPTYFVVAALDASNHVVAGYTGTISLTSTDGGAVFSTSSYVFQASDNGFHFFSVTFANPGLQTVTASDSGNSLTGNANIWVFQKW